MRKANTQRIVSLVRSWFTTGTTAAAATTTTAAANTPATTTTAAAAIKKTSPERDFILNRASESRKEKCASGLIINHHGYFLPFLAFCDTGGKDYLLPMLERVDITQMSLDNKTRIFRCLGRLSLESHAENFLLALKEYDVEPEDISGLIFSYATHIPNLTVEDVLLRFENLHRGIEMTPSSTSYAKLIAYSCDLLEVQVVFDLESSKFNLFQRIYSLICHYHLKLNMKTFKQLISLSVKMKDFDGAYGMLNYLMKLNLTPSTCMYNAIIGGYFREKKSVNDVSIVLDQMKLAFVKRAHVKADSITYALFINNSNSEEATEYYEDLKAWGVNAKKQIFMALINTFARCGQLEKAKQVLLYKGIPVNYIGEIKSVLVSTLTLHGEMADALDIYDKIKEDGGKLTPRTVMCLIEHLQHRGELRRVLQLVEELHDPQYFVDGCNKAIRCCIRDKHLRHTVNLLKRLKDTFCNDELAVEGLFDEVFSLISDTEPVDLQIGLDLLQSIKYELGVTPSHRSLDFLLNACIKAKHLRNCLGVWKEYQAAGLPYNVTDYLRMYQGLLVCQDFESAEIMLRNIPRDDSHVCMLIEAYQKKYIWSNSSRIRVEAK